MPTLDFIAASPATITPGQSSLITVDATQDPAPPDVQYDITGTVVGSDPPQTASVVVTLDNPPAAPLRFRLPQDTASGDVPGDIRLSLPDGGSLARTATAHQFTFAP